MSKIYVQEMPVVASYSGSLAAAGSFAGSMIAQGYAKLVGIHYSDASGVAASSLRISQSTDYGVNWDYKTDYVSTASATSAISLDIYGNAVRVFYKTDSAASKLRMRWMLRPI